MNAAAQTIPPLGEIEDFIECCDVHAWFHRQGWISLHTAVDNLQRLAERWGLIDLHGQDEIQAQMAFAFGWVGVDEIPSDRAAQLVRQLKLADPRDRWRHTGELPPGSDLGVPAPRHRAPQATIDAFWYVVRQDDAEYLGRWLANHPLDASHLHEIWRAKCSTAAA
jgi:hypothetical protein